MEPIQRSLRKFMKNRDFLERYEQIKQAVLNDEEIRFFLYENREGLNEQIIDKSLNKLHEYMTQRKNCRECKGLAPCQNLMKGYEPRLVFDGKFIDVTYDKCHEKRLDEEKRRQYSLIKSLYMPKDILQASFDQLDTREPGRLEAISKAADFLENYETGKSQKGLFFHGPFGVGKTHILGAIANELAGRGIASMLVYTPEFMRELKGSFQDHSLNDKVEAIKKVEVLMFDDIGAESMSSWMRDEILGTILQYRMMEDLPTLFTSNMNYSQLEHHLSTSQRGEVEEMKARRVMERIKFLTLPVEITGKNRRYE